MKLTGLVAAPYYFERVAILYRKQKKYALEINICEKYIGIVNSYYRKIKDLTTVADIRKGPRYQAIVKRLPKAKELMAKSRDITS